MKRMLMLLALCATVIPAVALAQAGPGAGVRPPPSPEQRAMMEKLRTDAKATAYGALTPVHRDRVTAIVADVAAGKQDRAAAAKLIDDVLTPDEQKAVRDAAAAAFRARRMAMGGPPPGPPNAAQPGPNGPPRADGPPRAFGPDGGRFSPSAGRYLLMVSMSREQMRNTMPRARSGSAS